MPLVSVSALRRKFPALCFAVLLNIAAIALLLQTMPKTAAPAAPEIEAKISLLPQLPPSQAPKRRIRRPASGPNAITPTFNPDDFRPSMLPQPQGLELALGACAPDRYDRASESVRQACDRIGMIVADDPGRFGVDPGFVNGKRWQRELLIKQTPLLLPCMSADANVLYTLFCVYDVLWNGYDPDKLQHYGK